MLFSLWSTSILQKYSQKKSFSAEAWKTTATGSIEWDSSGTCVGCFNQKNWKEHVVLFLSSVSSVLLTTAPCKQTRLKQHFFFSSFFLLWEESLESFAAFRWVFGPVQLLVWKIWELQMTSKTVYCHLPIGWKFQGSCALSTFHKYLITYISVHINSHGSYIINSNASETFSLNLKGYYIFLKQIYSFVAVVLNLELLSTGCFWKIMSMNVLLLK